MLGILPFVILLTISLLVLLLGRFRSRLGMIWIISAGIVYFNWVGVILLHLSFPKAFVISNWLPGQISTDAIRFEFTPGSWVLAIFWLALLVSVIFADASGLEDPHSSQILSGSLVLSAVTLLSLISSSLLAFLITWSLVDLIEFIILSRLISDTELIRKTIISFAFRITGTLFVIAALAVSKQTGQGLELSSASGAVYSLLILGVGFRLGVLPLQLPFTPSESIRRSMGTLLRLAAPVSAFALLIQLPAAESINGILLFVAILATLEAIYGALVWATSVNELAGRQYWSLSLAGLAMLAALKGQTSVVLACGGILITVGGFMFVQSVRERKYLIPFILMMVVMIGLPFTPFAGLWGFSGGAAWSFTRLVQVTSMAILTYGTYRLYEKKEQKESAGQNWISFFATAGLVILAITPWVTLIWSTGLLQLNPGWWYSLIMLGIIAIGIVLRTFFMRRLKKSDRVVQFIRDVYVIGARSLRSFFRFDWFYSLFGWIFHQFQILVQFLESVMEGEGGILWAMVFLALLASVLASAGK